MRAGRKGFAVAIAMAMTATVIGVWAGPAGAAVQTVTHCGDFGPGTLRYAVASADPGDTIAFAMSPPCNVITLASEIVITDNGLTIQGPGADNLRVSGNDTTRVFRNPAATGVTISGLTIEHGNGGAFGGGISNEGSMTVTQSRVVNNTTAWGAGIYNNGTLTVSASTVSDNDGLAMRGGGIYNNADGTMTVTGSVVSGNTSAEAGGIGNDGSMTVAGSVVSTNHADSGGGGIQSSGPLTVTDSTVSDNTAQDGGGIQSFGALTVTGSTISGNTTGVGGQGGGISTSTFATGSDATITASTITGNNASYGAGIANGPNGTVNVRTSTLSDNNAVNNGGGIFSGFTATVNVEDSTLSANAAGGGGAAIYNYPGTTVTITGSTLAGNMTPFGGGVETAGGPGGPLSVGWSIFDGTPCGGAPITDLGYNVDSGSSCVASTAQGSVNGATTTFGSAAPADNGGPTKTIALLTGSAAIGLVPSQTTAACPRVDQRGVASLAGQPCDAGAYQTAGASSAYEAVGWGANDTGQLGNGTTATGTSVPVTLPGLPPAVAVSGGEASSCAVLADGTARCWGSNGSGQLGNGTTTDSLVPVTVMGLTNATAISVGGDHACALLGDGTVRCWGLNDEGQLGNGTNTPALMPVPVSGINDAVAVSAGRRHTCALRSGGAVSCWGQNVEGKLGNGTNTDTNVPGPVSGLTGAVSVAAGAAHSCAVLADGTGRCWGYNASGQLGNGSTVNSNVPVTVSGLTGAAAVAVGFNHACALLGTGGARCWGLGIAGQLGNGSSSSSSVPVTVSGLTGAVSISSSAVSNHACALLGDGTARCWGRNFEGQLGNAVALPGFDSNVPVPVQGDPDQVVLAVAVGAYHTLALQASGLTVDGSAGPLQPSGVFGIEVADIPADRIPLPLVDVGGTPIKRIDLGATGLEASPLAEIALADIPIKRIPLSTLPTTVGGGWAELLKDSSLAGVPLQSVTLDQVQALPESDLPANSPARALTLRDVDISASPIKRIALASLALGSLPIKRIPLEPDLAVPSDSSGDAARFDAWCGSGGLLPSLGFSCAGKNLDAQSPLLSIDLAGIPIKRIPIKRIPIKRIVLENAPIKRIPIKRIDLGVSPIKRIPIKRISTSASPIKRIELGLLSPESRNAVVDCGLFDCAAPGATIEDAGNANAVRDSAQLGDLAPASVLDGYVLEDLGEGIDDSWSLADVLVGLAPRASLPWEDAPLTSLGLESIDSSAAGTVAEEASFRLLAGRPAGPTPLSAKLGGDLLLVEGSATLTGPQAFASGPVTAVQSGQVVTFPNLPADAPPGSYRLNFDVRGGLAAGTFPVSVTVGALRAGAQTTTAVSNPIAVVAPDEPANDTTPAAIAPDRLYVGHLGDNPGSSTDVDLYTMSVPPVPGTVTTVTLSHLAVDGDLAAFPSQASPPLRSSGFRGIGLQSPPPETTDPDLRTSAPGGQPQDTQGIPRFDGRAPSAVSGQRGTATEEIRLVSRGEGGSYTFQISAYNGSTSPDPYLVLVRQETPAGAAACPARTTPPPVASVLPGSLPSGTETLLLVNAARLTGAYPAEAATVLADLAAVAADPKIKGVVVPVDGSPVVQAAYAAWDSQSCSVDAANEVVNRINDLVDGLAPPGSPERTALRSIVVVGGDDQIPMARVPDGTTKSNESTYAGDVRTADASGVPATANPLSAALANHNILSDDPYGDFDPIAWKDRALYVPDVALGRLVESGAQIASQLEAYLEPQTAGRIEPTTSLTAGYDFLTDASAAIDEAIGTAVADRVSGFIRDTLVSDVWTRTDLLDRLLPTGPAPGISSVNAHFDHHRALPAAGNTEGDESDLVSTADLVAFPGKLAGDLLFSLGCHSGLAFPDAYAGATAGNSAQDWPQALGAQGALYVANTGYGYGDTAAVALSERLMKLYAQHLDGTTSAGGALTRAKQEYFASLAAFSDYDAKILMESTFYGIPNYEVGAPATPPPPPDPLPVEPDPVTNLTSALVDLAPTFATVNGPGGTTYTTADGRDPQVTPGQPIQPRSEVDVTQPGQLAHGALITALSSTDTTVSAATFASPTVDAAVNEPTTAATGAAFPSTLQTINTYNTDAGTRQRLNIIPGQFISAGDASSPAAGVQRRFDSISSRVLYRPLSDTDFTAPQVSAVAAEAASGHVDFELAAVDPGGSVVRVLVLYLDGSTWRSVDLTLSGAQWVGTGPATNEIVDYFVQVVDASGNVTTSSNKATNFTSEPPNASPTISGGADATLDTGDELVQTGSFTDPDQGPWTATVDYGRSGDGPVPLPLDGKVFTLRATYPDVGTYDVSLEVCDARGACGTDVVTVNVTEAPPNQTPAVFAGSDATLADGGDLLVSGSFADPDRGPWTATVDYGRPGDGPVPLALDGNRFTLDATYPNTGTYDVAVEVCDDAGACATDVLAVSVDLATTFSVGDAAILEGDSGTRTLKFPVTLRQPATATVTVQYAVTGDGAGSIGATKPGPGVDFRLKSGTLTFKRAAASGKTPVTQFVAVTVYGDTAVEPDESVQVTLSNPSTGFSLARAVGSGSVLSDDSGTGIKLGIGDLTVVEGKSGTGRNLVFPVTLSAPATSAVSAQFVVEGLGATYGKKATSVSDFGGKTAGTVSFPLTSSGKTGVTKTISIPVWADARTEPDETFRITLSTPSGPVTVIRSIGTGTILDDD